MQLRDDVPNIMPFDKNETHDAEGIIFNRVVYRSVISSQEAVAWSITRNTKLTPQDCWVREYDADGKIVGHLSMPFFTRMVSENPEALSDNFKRDMPKIKRAIAEFIALRS